MSEPTVLWLDDVRKPEGWEWPSFGRTIWVRSYTEAIAFWMPNVEIASLDHDLGTKKNGADVVKWIIKHDAWPTDRIVVHSWNVPAAKRMCDLIDSFGPYEKRCRHIPAIGAP